MQPIAKRQLVIRLDRQPPAGAREIRRHRSLPGLEVQLAFADRELRGEPAYAGFWRASSEKAFPVLRQCFGRGRC